MKRNTKCLQETTRSLIKKSTLSYKDIADITGISYYQVRAIALGFSKGNSAVTIQKLYETLKGSPLL